MGTYNGFEREEVEPGVFDDVFRDIGAAPPPCISKQEHAFTSSMLPWHNAQLVVAVWIIIMPVCEIV